LSNLPTILVVILILLLILAALVIVLGPGGNLLGTASNPATPTRGIGPQPAATRDRPPGEETPISVQVTEVSAATSTALPPSVELSPTSERAIEPSPTSVPPTPTSAPTASVRPVVECVTDNGDGTYTAYFGYRNAGDETITVPIGSRNRIAPAPENRGQPTTFSPGGTAPWPNAPFSTIFSGGTLSWSVEGQTATASPDSPPCAYRVHIDVRWYAADGTLLAGPPETLPPEFSITAQSQLGSATCTYPDGSSLVCQYDDQMGDGGALLVPPGTSYSTDESGLPAGWLPFSGVGVFPGSGGSQTVSHVIDNRAPGAPTPSPTPSPTPTPDSSGASRPTPTPSSPQPAAPTASPTTAPASTVVPSRTPTASATPAGEAVSSPAPTAAAGQTTPAPTAADPSAPLLPTTGGGGRRSLLGIGSLILGMALALLGLWAIGERRRPD
jgi:hypothetical protein